MNKHGVLSIILCLIVSALPGTAQEQIKTGPSPSLKSWTGGVLVGVARNDIDMNSKFNHNPESVNDNIGFQVGAFVQTYKYLLWEADLLYKERVFSIENHALEDYGYDADMNMQYLELMFKFGPRFEVAGVSTHLFCGLGWGHLLNAKEKYVVNLGGVMIRGEFELNNDGFMKKCLDRNSIVYNLGINLNPSFLQKRFEIGMSVDFVKPTKEYAKKELEGAYDPLFNEFWLSNISVYCKFAIFPI